MDSKLLLKKIHKDKRSASQVFESLRQEIMTFSENNLTDEEATQAARNLIGVFETTMMIPKDKRSIFLEEQSDEG